MADFDHIINWKLQQGSHEFPGPDGGTCINEAAIVAAGFEYNPVGSWRDCPPCFSPVLSQFAIVVNDRLNDGDRQALLMPLVTKLAGSKDSEEWVEDARARFILDSCVRQLIRPILEHGVRELEMRRVQPYRYISEDPLGAARSPAEIADCIKRADRDIDHPEPAEMVAPLVAALVGAWRILECCGEIRWMPPRGRYLPSLDIAAMTATETQTISYEALGRWDFWPRCATILTRAFRIGTQAPVADTAKVIERMEAAKVLANA